MNVFRSVWFRSVPFVSVLLQFGSVRFNQITMFVCLLACLRNIVVVVAVAVAVALPSPLLAFAF